MFKTLKMPMKTLFYLYIVISVTILIVDILFKILSDSQRNTAFYVVLILNVIFAFLYKKEKKS